MSLKFRLVDLANIKRCMCSFNIDLIIFIWLDQSGHMPVFKTDAVTDILFTDDS